jgi:hypothetical protein
MRAFMLVALFGMWSSSAWCHEAEIREVLAANFAACTEEDINVLMDTQARGLDPRALAEFRRQAEDVFAKTDMYLGLEEFEVTAVKLPYAAARVVQVTLPKDPELRNDPDQCKRFYREHAALLPAYERVEYVQTFKREKGQWKLWQITTEPRPVGEVSSAPTRQGRPTMTQQQSPCANGRCNKPRSNSSLFR